MTSSIQVYDGTGFPEPSIRGYLVSYHHPGSIPWFVCYRRGASITQGSPSRAQALIMTHQLATTVAARINSSYVVEVIPVFSVQ